MGFEFVKKLPTPAEIKEQYPVSKEIERIKAERDEEIKKVITGESDKFLAIIGPCSADNEDAVCDYINRLAPIQEKIKDKVIIIPRIYTNRGRLQRNRTSARPRRKTRFTGRINCHEKNAYACHRRDRTDSC